MSRIGATIASGTRFVERLILGLWLALIGAGIAVFASAVPYLYAEELMIRCGALALTQLTLKVIIVGGMGAVVLLAIALRMARFFLEVSLSRWLRILRPLAFIFWVLVVAAGTGQFFNLIYVLESTIDDPPQPPTDMKERFDLKVCRDMITKSHPHDLRWTPSAGQEPG